MRVLILDEQFREPPLDGGSRSLWDLRRSLTELGHDVILSGDDSLLEGESWDVVMVSRPLLAARVADRASHAARSQTVYLGHDLHHRRLAAASGILPGQPRPVEVMKALERRCWAVYDITLYPNHEEVAEVRRAGAHARWFPYFRIDAISPSPGRSSTVGPLTLLFVGGSDHAPNVTGLRWFASDILPLLPGVQVLVAGSWNPALRDPLTELGLQFTGALSDTALAALRSGINANIAPLTAGAGLKSKVIEALASGTPLIATSTAMAGIPSPWQLALPGDTCDQWHQALQLMRIKPRAATRLSTRAGAYVGEHHGPAAYLRALSAIFDGR